ncbi:MAG: hypothetical protein UT79_C0003G0089, partial [Candidatus Moranbacteria bacterium GW2011_GWC2_40_12]
YFSIKGDGNIGIGTDTPGSAGLAIMNGNVGIGTTAPASKLTVSGGVGIGTTAPGSLFLSTAAPDGGMIIEGNVGIGTTSPGAALNIVSETEPLRLGYSSTVYDKFIVNSSGALTISKNGTSDVATFTHDMSTFISGKYTMYDFTTYRYFGTSTDNTNDLGSSALRWRDIWLARNAYVNGSVGIGTTAPAGIFQVGIGASTPLFISSAGNIGIGTTAVGSYLLNIASGYSTNFNNGSISAVNTISSTGILRLDAGGTLGQIRMDNVGVGIGNNDVAASGSKLTVWGQTTITGNVGIGTTDPGSKLSISGGVGIGTTAPGSLYLSAKAPDGGMIVEGNVGIGTTNPAGLFAVGASSNFMVSSSGIIETINGVTSAGLSSGGLDLVNNSGMVVVRNNANAINSMISLESGTGSGSGIFFKTANSYRGIINGSGYLGIGTTNPIANLEVGTTNPLLVYADNLASNEGLAGVVLSSKGTGSLVLQPSGNVGSVSAKTQLIYYNGANTFSALEYGNVSSGYSSLLLMKSGGNVGIGTTAPGYKLEVYTGSASGWPQKEYRTDGIGSRPGNGAQSGDVQHERGIKLRSRAYGLHRPRCGKSCSGAGYRRTQRLQGAKLRPFHPPSHQSGAGAATRNSQFAIRN